MTKEKQRKENNWIEKLNQYFLAIKIFIDLNFIADLWIEKKRELKLEIKGKS